MKKSFPECWVRGSTLFVDRRRQALDWIPSRVPHEYTLFAEDAWEITLKHFDDIWHEQDDDTTMRIQRSRWSQIKMKPRSSWNQEGVKMKSRGSQDEVTMKSRWSQDDVKMKSRWSQDQKDGVKMKPRWSQDEIKIKLRWSQDEAKAMSRWRQDEVKDEVNMKSRWSQHEVRMKSTWRQDEVNINSTWSKMKPRWSQHEDRMNSRWRQGRQDEVQMKSRWSQDEVKMRSRWSQDEVKMKSRWSQDEVKINSRWSQDEVKMRSRWSQDEVKMKSRWSQDKLKMKSRWSQDEVKMIVKMKSRWSQEKPRRANWGAFCEGDQISWARHSANLKAMRDDDVDVDDDDDDDDAEDADDDIMTNSGDNTMNSYGIVINSRWTQMWTHSVHGRSVRSRKLQCKRPHSDDSIIMNSDDIMLNSKMNSMRTPGRTRTISGWPFWTSWAGWKSFSFVPLLLQMMDETAIPNFSEFTLKRTIQWLIWDSVKLKYEIWISAFHLIFTL